MSMADFLRQHVRAEQSFSEALDAWDMNDSMRERGLFRRRWYI